MYVSERGTEIKLEREETQTEREAEKKRVYVSERRTEIKLEREETQTERERRRRKECM